MIKSIENLRELRADLKEQSSFFKGTKIVVSLGTCGIAAGGQKVMDELTAAIENHKLTDSVELIETGCMGLCHSEPTIEVIHYGETNGIIYGNVKPSHVKNILDGLDSEITGVDIIERTWYYPEKEENTDSVLQAKIVLQNCGKIDPESIDDYIIHNGYLALENALEKEPSEVISVVRESGLRGRGGGGFPTGVKWQFAADQKVDEKYVICNADEGDPGAFMDRAVLEGDPHAVLEAMMIAGYAIGASNGVIYIRAEYPLAIERLRKAIDQAHAKNLLGTDILGTGFNFDIDIKYGAGAFVCGEETALIHSIEGMRGEPTLKPPFPAIEGLWKKPTIVNNVETFANVCAILRNSAEWFKQLGTEGSPGTKVFALAGKIKKVGLIEVPMGIRLEDIIYGLGDGIYGGKKFKAVQTGGPSGGAITSDNLDIEIDYDTLKAHGSMMGSGGMIVMDEDDCMVNIARFFLEFTLDESCGKCTPCRVGNKRSFEILDKICRGEGTMEDLDLLKELAAMIKNTSLCGLGQTAPNPVLSTMKTFEDEYLAHIKDKKCPAGSCTDLIEYVINDKCIGCTLCAKKCPVNCISGERKEMHSIDQEKCIKCGVCYNACKFSAIEKR